MGLWTTVILTSMFVSFSMPLTRAEELKFEEVQTQVKMLAEQGQLEEAAQLGEQSLRMTESRFGPSHPNVAQYLGLLAGVYLDQGRDADAGSLLGRVVKIWDGLNERAVTDVRYRHYAEGTVAAQDALKLAEEAFGSEGKLAKYTAVSWNTLGLLQEAQEHYDEAEISYQHSVRVKEAVFGSDDFEVTAPMANLALLYHSQKQYEKAGALYPRLLHIYEKTQSPDHPHVVKLLDMYADILRKTNRIQEAQVLEGRAGSIRKQKEQ